MPLNALTPPAGDPTPIFEHFRGAYATELLTAAVAHLRVFDHLATGPVAERELQARLQLQDRPYVVLMTALRAMGLVVGDQGGAVQATPLAREHLAPAAYFSVADYIGLAAESPGVLAMVERLRTNRPAHAAKEDEGAAFIFREGLESAMDREASARRLTLALAGRAKNVAPLVAARAPLEGARLLLDLGGGTGIYAIACLQQHPNLKAVVFDRPEVLKVAAEFAQEFGVADRLECIAGDMFEGPLPRGADAILLSNILHDWDVPECQRLVARCAESLPAGGKLLIHDVFLNDALDGPLPLALYSAALFTLTEGRAYSAAEYREWLTAAGLRCGEVVPTLIHCGLLAGTKQRQGGGGSGVFVVKELRNDILDKPTPNR